jgi:alcohol dehydrogenase class IV
MSATNRITVQRLRTSKESDISLKKYAQLGRIFLGEENKNDGYFIDFFLDFLDQLTDELRLPGLRKAGIREEDLPRIARLTENKNNPVKLTPDDLLEILKIRYI